MVLTRTNVFMYYFKQNIEVADRKSAHSRACIWTRVEGVDKVGLVSKIANTRNPALQTIGWAQANQYLELCVCMDRIILWNELSSQLNFIRENNDSDSKYGMQKGIISESRVKYVGARSSLLLFSAKANILI